MAFKREIIKVQKFRIDPKRGGVGVGTVHEVYKDIYLGARRAAEKIRLDKKRADYKGAFDNYLPVEEIEALEKKESFEKKLSEKAAEITRKGDIQTTPEGEITDDAEVDTTTDVENKEPGKKRGRKPKNESNDNNKMQHYDKVK